MSYMKIADGLEYAKYTHILHAIESRENRIFQAESVWCRSTLRIVFGVIIECILLLLPALFESFNANVDQLP